MLPSWWSYFTYNDSENPTSQGRQLIFIAMVKQTLVRHGDDTLAVTSYPQLLSNPSNASVAATNTAQYSVTAVPTGKASVIDLS